MLDIDFSSLTHSLAAAHGREQAAWQRHQRALARLGRLKRWRLEWLSDGRRGAAPRLQARFWLLQHETEAVLQAWVFARAAAQAQVDGEAIGACATRAEQEVPQELWDWVFLGRD
jgi:hypothetical protein